MLNERRTLFSHTCFFFFFFSFHSLTHSLTLSVSLTLSLRMYTCSSMVKKKKECIYMGSVGMRVGVLGREL